MLSVFSVLADVAQFDVNLSENNGGKISPLSTSKFFTETGTVYLALSFGTTLVLMLLIVYRIMSINTRNRAIWEKNSLDDAYGPSASRVRSAVEILVESSMMYAISIFVLFVLLAIENPTYVYAQAVVTQITVGTSACAYHVACSRLKGLAPTLILTRISLGLARPPETWTSSRPTNFTSVHFGNAVGMEGGGESQASRSTPARGTGTDSTVSAGYSQHAKAASS